MLAADLLWRPGAGGKWLRTPLEPRGNDRWTATFTPPKPGRYEYAIEAWTDVFATWRRDILAKRQAGLDVSLETLEGRQILEDIKPRNAADARLIRELCRDTETGALEPLLLDEVAAAAASDQQTDLTRSAAMPLVADRARARAGAWYEMVPRSQGRVPGRHGTFDDCIARLPEIAALGFDVVYLTPIHPIGRTNRKGKNNSLTAGPDDPGSPYAIGSARAATTPSIRELGTLDGFPPLRRRLRATTAWRWRSTSPSSARPTIHGSSSIRNGSSAGPTARSNTPRTRRRNTRTSSIRISTAPTADRAMAGAARRRAVLGRAGRAHLPRRQSAHQAVPVLGMADPRGAGAHPGRASSWPRHSPGRR